MFEHKRRSGLQRDIKADCKWEILSLIFIAFKGKELDGINNVIVQILRLAMPDSTIPLTNPQSREIFPLPKTIGQGNSGNDKGYQGSEKDSDEGRRYY